MAKASTRKKCFFCHAKLDTRWRDVCRIIWRLSRRKPKLIRGYLCPTCSRKKLLPTFEEPLRKFGDVIQRRRLR